MRCPRCEADNPEGMKFCIECATPLARRCPQCDFANPPQAKFCGQCASSLTGQTPTPPPSSAIHPPLSYTPGHLVEKILTAKTALEGERKQVTMLFADLKGSMELLTDRDPEDARQLLDPVLERMMDAVHRFEGTADPFMCGGVGWDACASRSGGVVHEAELPRPPVARAARVPPPRPTEVASARNTSQPSPTALRSGGDRGQSLLQAPRDAGQLVDAAVGGLGHPRLEGHEGEPQDQKSASVVPAGPFPFAIRLSAQLSEILDFPDDESGGSRHHAATHDRLQ